MIYDRFSHDLPDDKSRPFWGGVHTGSIRKHGNGGPMGSQNPGGVPTNSATLDRTMPCSPFPKSHFPSYVVCLDVCGLHSQSWVDHDIVFADMNIEVSMGVHYLGVLVAHYF